MIVSFIEMSKFQAILSANLCCCITADQTLSLHFLVGWSCFCRLILMVTPGSMKISHNLFSASKRLYKEFIKPLHDTELTPPMVETHLYLVMDIETDFLELLNVLSLTRSERRDTYQLNPRQYF